jgi:Ca2+/Na+ antiporter
MENLTKYHINAESFNGNVDLDNRPFKEDKTSVLRSFCIVFAIIGFIFLLLKLYVSGIAFLIPIFLYFIYLSKSSKHNETYKQKYRSQQNLKLKKDAEELSQKLKDLIIKSQELATIGLSAQTKILEEKLAKIKFEFSDNALIPFWDEVENFMKELDQYQNTLSLLENNSKTYYRFLRATNNNFPTKFPIQTSIQVPTYLLTEFERIKREAFKKFEYANLWEQRKTQKILILGFTTLAEAIENMNRSITNSVNNLTNVVQNGFENMTHELRELRELTIQQHSDFVSANEELENTLDSIDKKLYYIQYNRKPIEPFRDIYAPKR